jgi:hypothetical protein
MICTFSEKHIDFYNVIMSVITKLFVWKPLSQHTTGASTHFFCAQIRNSPSVSDLPALGVAPVACAVLPLD